jgi:hypothetical protein
MTQFFHSYLVGYLFWFNIGVGCLGLLLLHQLTGGEWGTLIGKVIRAGSATMPLLAILFLPILAGITHLYPWAQPKTVLLDPVLQSKRIFLNVPFFILRAAGYFAILSGIASRVSRPQRRQGEAGVSLFILALTVTFAAIDWMMSLEPLWYSTIYGIMMGMGDLLTALCFAVVILKLGGEKMRHSPEVSVKALHDVGNLILAFLMFWAYTAYFQYLIIWSGNLPEEISWYLHRQGTGWTAVALVLVLGHFFGPFLLLLFREVKRSLTALAWVAGWVLLMRWVLLFWLVMPAFSPGHFHFHWLDILIPAAVGGMWLNVFLRKLE